MNVIEQEVPEGYKRTELGVIPEGWAVDSLESTCPQGRKHNIVDGPFGSNLKTEHYKKSGIPIISSGFVTSGQFFAEDYLYVEEAKFRQEKRSAVKPNDIVMAKIGARCGSSAIFPKHHEVGIISGNALKITVDDSKHNNYFIWQLLWNTYSKGNLEDITTTGAQPAISMSSLKKLQLPLPSIKEQTAIANALSDVDALSTELEKLIAKKLAIKTATMQQLLTGKTRLPQFSTYTKGAVERKSQGQEKGKKTSELGETPEDWDFINIGNNAVLKARIGWQALTTKEYLDTGSKYLVTGTDFDAGEVNWNSCCFVSDWRYKQDTNIQLKENDVLITKDGTIGKVGFINDLPLPATLNSGVFVVRPRAKSFYPKYLFYVLTSSIFKSFIKGITAGSTITHLYQKDFVHFEFPAPDIEEQTAIATILSDMDNEIQTLEQRLTKTRQIKQGMMQQLLTGRTRLPFNKEAQQGN